MTYKVIILVTKEEIYVSDDLKYIPINSSIDRIGYDCFYREIDREFNTSPEALAFMKTIHKSRSPSIIIQR